MIDTLADLVPLYGIILIISIWCFGSHLISKRYSKDLKLLELHDRMKIKLGEELNVPKEEVLEVWFDRSIRDAKGVYVIDNKIFSNYIFTVKYTTKEDSYEVETFTKAQKEVADF
ncbi:hypothetical protein AM4_014 [Lactococcus phage AM4]|uniref:Uncharacterized protein n=2 Tax=Audreyjarvisvirus AM4 TaxID=2845189 RepID=A0A1W6JKE0_9CAUD|nr:hypothetical protein H1Z35_gp014 [Lactococcus phage AM4]ARM66673.1 hypothetical protein AM4_014 [Lactococcus phage AM4]ARM66867.1 hypothetical protein AM5_014 [Lactococcus phage AM5]